MNSKILKISFYNHIASLTSLIIYTFLAILVMVWFKFDSIIIKVFGIAFLIDAIPAIYLHIEYWIINRNVEYEISENEIIQKKRGMETCYKSEDIEKVFICLSPSLYRNSNLHIFAIESYHYAQIRLKTGENLILTCLLSPRMYLEFEKMKGIIIIKEKRLFCTVD